MTPTKRWGLMVCFLCFMDLNNHILSMTDFDLEHCISACRQVLHRCMQVCIREHKCCAAQCISKYGDIDTCSYIECHWQGKFPVLEIPDGREKIIYPLSRQTNKLNVIFVLIGNMSEGTGQSLVVGLNYYIKKKTYENSSEFNYGYYIGDTACSDPAELVLDVLLNKNLNNGLDFIIAAAITRLPSESTFVTATLFSAYEVLHLAYIDEYQSIKSLQESYHSLKNFIPLRLIKSEKPIIVVKLLQLYNLNYISIVYENSVYGENVVQLLEESMKQNQICIANTYAIKKEDKADSIRYLLESMTENPHTQMYIVVAENERDGHSLIKEAILSNSTNTAWFNYFDVENFYGLAQSEEYSKLRKNVFYISRQGRMYESETNPLSYEVQSLCFNNIDMYCEISDWVLYSEQTANLLINNADKVLRLSQMANMTGDYNFTRDFYSALSRNLVGEGISVSPDELLLFTTIKTDTGKIKTVDIAYWTTYDIPEKFYELIIILFSENDTSDPHDMKYWRPIVQQYLKSVEKLRLYKEHKNVSLNKNLCEDVCQAGFYAIPVKGSSCCWTCHKCVEHYIKSNPGINTNCEKCPQNSISNVNRTHCLPITKSYHYLGYDLQYIPISLASIGIIVTVFFMALLIKNKNTPIVLSMDSKVSSIQLTSHLLLFVQLFSFVPTITIPLCHVRPILSGFFLVVILSMNLIKAQHFLFIFHAKKRLNAHDVQVERVKSLLIFFTVLSIYIITNFMIVLYQPIHYTIERNIVKLIDMHSCNNNRLSFVQIMFSLLLSLICSVQAFRSRSLPKHFEESRFIAFAMFTSNIILACLIPLHLSQTNPRDSDVVDICVLFTCNASILLIMFGYRVKIILFRPSENTRERFREILFHHAENETHTHSMPTAVSSV